MTDDYWSFYSLLYFQDKLVIGGFFYVSEIK